MEFRRLFNRAGAGRKQNKLPSFSYTGALGVDYASSPYAMEQGDVPYALNADFGNPIGSITKAPGYKAIFPSLGDGGVHGLHLWPHSSGDKMIMAWDGNLYQVAGDDAFINVTSQADWEQGEYKNVDTASEPGSIKLGPSGSSYSYNFTPAANMPGELKNTLRDGSSVKLGPAHDEHTQVLFHFNGNFNEETGKTVTVSQDRYSTQNGAMIEKAAELSSGSPISGGSGCFQGSFAHSSMYGLPVGTVGCSGQQRRLTFGDFTVEFWVRANSSDIRVGRSDGSNYSYGYIVNQASDWFDAGESQTGIGYGWALTLYRVWNDSTNTPYLSGFGIQADYTPYVGQWVHVAFVGLNGTVKMYINGQEKASGTITNGTQYIYTNDYTQPVQTVTLIGNDISSGGANRNGFFTGRIDELRISTVARYTEEFTPSLYQFNIDGYAFEGFYTHPEQDISSLGITTGVYASYAATTPAGTEVVLEARYSPNNGKLWTEWKAVANGGEVLSAGTSLTRGLLQWRARLIARDNSKTPLFSNISLNGGSGLNSDGYWQSPLYDYGKEVNGASLFCDPETPEGTDVLCYSRGSSDGKVFGSWTPVDMKGGRLPRQRFLQLRFELKSVSLTISPVVDSFRAVYSRSYSKPYKLDISPLQRLYDKLTGNMVCFVNYEDWLLCADGLRPWIIYMDYESQKEGTAVGGSDEYIDLEDDASDRNGFYSNAMLSVIEGAGAGQIRFIERYEVNADDGYKRAYVSEPFDPAVDESSVYSISASLKVRNLGVNVPETAPETASPSTSGYMYKYTFVNADGIEGNPSPASGRGPMGAVTVPIDDTPFNLTVKRRLYRTASNANVFKFVAEIDDNTTTSYTDTTSDALLGSLMMDNNNGPPDAAFLFEFNGYVFYAHDMEVWFSKPGQPDLVPNIPGDQRVMVFPGVVGDISNHPSALIVSGEIFKVSITASAGFIFDSDPTIDTTMMHVVDNNGGLSWNASQMCISPSLRTSLLLNTATGIRAVVPGIQDDSIEPVPISYKIQPYYESSINREKAAAVFFKDYYIYSMEYLGDEDNETRYITFALDFRLEGSWRWRGPWLFGMSCYAKAKDALYSGDVRQGKVYRMFSGHDYDGEKVDLTVDFPMIAPAGEEGTCAFYNYTCVFSGDSNTSATLAAPKVDDHEEWQEMGDQVNKFAGEVRPGHDLTRSLKFPIHLPDGHTFSLRVKDESLNQVRLLKAVVEYEVLDVNY